MTFVGCSQDVSACQSKIWDEGMSAGELSVSPWDPSNVRRYLGFRAVSEEDPGKVIYMLYLSKEQVVYLDTFQWEEISRDLKQEAVKATGLEQVCCDTMQYSEVDMRDPYYHCPWVEQVRTSQHIKEIWNSFLNRKQRQEKTCRIRKNWGSSDQRGRCALFWRFIDSDNERANRESQIGLSGIV